MLGDFLFGLVFGAGMVWIIILATYSGYRRSFKLYLSEQSDETRSSIQAMMFKAYDDIEALATKTNSKFFKAMYNDLVELKSFLDKKWMQN